MGDAMFRLVKTKDGVKIRLQILGLSGLVMLEGIHNFYGRLEEQTFRICSVRRYYQVAWRLCGTCFLGFAFLLAYLRMHRCIPPCAIVVSCFVE
uniref:Uncharacterized protein n=1 Tax=Rhipicephalus zambeziensis TaxID=60191 RepID=A0A224YG18_9ACAR